MEVCNLLISRGPGVFLDGSFVINFTRGTFFIWSQLVLTCSGVPKNQKFVVSRKFLTCTSKKKIIRVQVHQNFAQRAQKIYGFLLYCFGNFEENMDQSRIHLQLKSSCKLSQNGSPKLASYTSNSPILATHFFICSYYGLVDVFY